MLSGACVTEWHQKFSEGQENVEHDERPGPSLTARTEGKV